MINGSLTLTARPLPACAPTSFHHPPRWAAGCKTDDLSQATRCGCSGRPMRTLPSAAPRSATTAVGCRRANRGRGPVRFAAPRNTGMVRCDALRDQQPTRFGSPIATRSRLTRAQGVTSTAYQSPTLRQLAVQGSKPSWRSHAPRHDMACHVGRCRACCRPGQARARQHNADRRSTRDGCSWPKPPPEPSGFEAWKPLLKMLGATRSAGGPADRTHHKIPAWLRPETERSVGHQPRPGLLSVPAPKWSG